MVHLTDRLMCLAGEIPKGHITADIGTDHGLLPIFLYGQGISPHVILSDVNSGPLEKARENIALYAPEENFDIRLGSGLETLSKGEADSVVIAGMGGLLMVSILELNMEKTRSFKQFVLQPRNAQDKLRKWLLSRGFAITNESLVREGKFICEIITASPSGLACSSEAQGFTASCEATAETSLALVPETGRGSTRLGSAPSPEDWVDLEISPLLFLKKDPLLKEFIQRKIAVEEKIMAEIVSGRGSKDHERYRGAEERRRRLADRLEGINW